MTDAELITKVAQDIYTYTADLREQYGREFSEKEELLACNVFSLEREEILQGYTFEDLKELLDNIDTSLEPTLYARQARKRLEGAKKSRPRLWKLIYENPQNQANELVDAFTLIGRMLGGM